MIHAVIVENKTEYGREPIECPEQPTNVTEIVKDVVDNPGYEESVGVKTVDYAAREPLDRISCVRRWQHLGLD